MKRNRKPNKKKATRLALSDPETTLLRSLLNDIRNNDPTEIVSRIPSPGFARIFVDSLPLDIDSLVPLLSSIRERFKDKQVDRAIKRISYRLDKKGVPAGTIFAEDNLKATSVLKPPKKREHLAYVGPIDGMGYRALIIEAYRFSKGVDMGIGVVSDEHGIKEFLFDNFSKKQTKEMKGLCEDQAGPLVETSLSHAATIMEESYQRHVKINTDPPSGYLELRPWLLEQAPLLDKPIIYEVSDSDIDTDKVMTASQIERLFTNEMIESWLIDYDDIIPVIKELAEAEQSSIVLTEAQKFERVREIKEKGMKGLFPPEKRFLIKRRLEEMAYIFSKLDQKALASLSVAAAKTLDTEDSVIRANPVIEFYLERSLDFYMKSARRDDSDAGESNKGTSSDILLP